MGKGKLFFLNIRNFASYAFLLGLFDGIMPLIDGKITFKT